MPEIQNSAPWQFLQEHAEKMKKRHLKSLFDEDPTRFNRFSLQVQNILFDYSKNPICEETVSGLINLAHEANVEGKREQMFRGDRINTTEDRAVLHTALRNRNNTPIYVDNQNVMEVINKELEKIREFTDQVREDHWLGYSGKSITDVVNIGIGGSDLGPRMVAEALKPYADSKIRVHFLSNVDGVQIAEILRSLDPERVLFVISSKTFTTSETMINAQTARNWLMAFAFDERAVKKHFVAVSANKEAAQDFGIAKENIFKMWDWVGGRFSIWSAIGLPIALYLGFEQFEELLSGAHDMDCHFRSTPARDNAPILLALVGLWNSSFMGCQSQAILPYDQPLGRLAAYLQQAEMESNGKHINQQGEKVPYQTGSIIWGQLGIDGQHAFYQYLHQGTNIVPADFIGSIESTTPIRGHHENLMSNFFAQTKALMYGVDAETVHQELSEQKLSEEKIKHLGPHKVHEGNRPTNTLLLRRLDPRTLGALIALYEHKLFVQGIIWDICSFDQWGVELGKKLAHSILPELGSAKEVTRHDASTNSLINYFNQVRYSSK